MSTRDRLSGEQNGPKTTLVHFFGAMKDWDQASGPDSTGSQPTWYTGP